MSRTMLEAAARAEHAAERNRSAAEQRWRMMWWATTLELAKLDGRQDVTSAYDAVEKILGQNRGYLSKRRSAGQYLIALEGDGLETLPPRLAMEYVTAGGDRSDAVRYLKDAEQRGVSLRDLAAELGTQPKSWLREDEQDQRPADRAAVGAALTGLDREAQGDLIRELLADPEVAAAAFDVTDHQQHGSATQAALGNIAQAHARGEQRRQQERLRDLSPEARDVNEKIGLAGAKLDLEDGTTRFRGDCRRFAETVAKALPQAGEYSGSTGPLTLADNVARARADLQLALNALDALDTYVGGGATLDDALAKIMGDA